MKNLKVVRISSDEIEFDNGMRLYSDHYKDCCEQHFLDFSDLTEADFKGLKFDLSNDGFFRRIENYGIELVPVSGWSVKIPGYGNNNGYYSTSLDLIVSYPDGRGVFAKYDIEECQTIRDY